MRVLAIDAAHGGGAVALVEDGRVLASECTRVSLGLAGVLPVMAASVLRAGQPDGIAVTVGPGSFTGLRGAIALAQGLALGAAIPVAGISIREALLAGSPSSGDGRGAWIALHARRGIVFLDGDGVSVSVPLDALPRPSGPVLVAGNAAVPVAAFWAARGVDVRLSDARQVAIDAVARIGAARLAGTLPGLAAHPLYIDPPEAKPAGGLRPPPVPAA